MIIEECTNYWKVIKKSGVLSVCYKIDKEICTSKDEVIEYIKNNKLF